MSSLSLVVVLTLVAISFKGSTACKCIQLADESKICLADYVISGTLLETNSPAEQNSLDSVIDYRVSVGKVYRSFRKLPTTLAIRTEGHTCGFTDLQVNATYFIAGQIQDGMFMINRCSSVVAKYGPDNIPYRDSDVKVNVNVTSGVTSCHEEEGEVKGYGSAVLLTSNVGLLIFVLCAAILKMF
ncbi:uncharacterized protein LOC105447528 [Strongylocentrotus purpuratus]|uniref:NTR domain-containing protein n=1 Tax=Strongylocentrotus purpuratus TaxID=7668 RepID=A0A7M7HQM2_STRPU|nr:uncharacterized protein LOC105447528 [Strongylocentrotus purpuratus]XP_011684017.2 uncharacterized protein LOC105447528 [Strongylocentrotus purpuratus]